MCSPTDTAVGRVHVLTGEVELAKISISSMSNTWVNICSGTQL